MNGQRRIAVLLAALLCLTAGVLATRPVRAESAPANGPPRWTFRARSSVQIDTPIVRLGDVVEPVGPAVRAWPRLRRATIGLVPLDATPMVLQRDRLDRAIRSAEGISQEIEWLGPKEIEVAYEPSETSQNAPASTGTSASTGNSGSTATSAEVSGSAEPYRSGAIGSAIGRPTSSRHTSGRPRLDPTTAQRLVTWIESALRRRHPEAAERFGITIDPGQAALAPLESAQGIEQVAFVTPPREGAVQLQVAGRGLAEQSSATIEVDLTPNPKVAVATDRFRRGDRLTDRDVALRPWPEDQWDESFVTDTESLIGMEVRRPLNPDRPIRRSDIGAPILVRRGDEVQVRVVGQGITVTTEATATGNAAKGELVEVQTVRPRKKFVTRVVASGLVEIITRAPQVPR